MTAKTKPRRARIVWADHADEDQTWSKASDAADLHPVFFESIGWIIGESETIIELAGDRPLKRTVKGKLIPNTDDVWGRITRIVKAAIVSRSDQPKVEKKDNNDNQN